MNADLIRQGLSAQERLQKLRSVAYYQLNSLYNSNVANRLNAHQTLSASFISSLTRRRSFDTIIPQGDLAKW